MFCFGKSHRSDATTPQATGTSSPRRPVRAVPLVSELEDRRLLSVALLHHVAGLPAQPAIVAHTHAVHPHARVHVHPAVPVHQGLAAAPAATKPSGSIIATHNPAVFGGNASSTGTYNTDGGTALPGTNPGGGPVLSGSMNAPDDGMALPGTNPGGGPTPSGSLDGPTVIPGTSPGGGLEPSGTITGPMSP